MRKESKGCIVEEEEACCAYLCSMFCVGSQRHCAQSVGNGIAGSHVGQIYGPHTAR